MEETQVMVAPWKSEVPGRILHAAVALFSRQGYRGTSTREIARLADVSEVTVYRYFERKEDIFWSALVSSFNTIKPRLESLGTTLKRQTPELALPQILSILLDAATFSPELPRLIAVAFLEHRGKAEELCSKHLDPLFSTIVDYFATNIEAGTMRNLNPAMVTAAIALTVIAQPEISKLSTGPRISRLTGREAIHEYSTFWLNVLTPSQPAQVRGLTLAVQEPTTV